MADVEKIFNKANNLFAEGQIIKGLSLLLDLFNREITFKSHGSQIMNKLIDEGKKDPVVAFPYIAKYYKSEKNSNAKKRILSLFNTFIQEKINLKKEVDESNPWYSIIQTLKKSKDQDVLKFAIRLVSIYFNNNKEDFFKNYSWVAEILGNKTIFNLEYDNQAEIYSFFENLVDSEPKFIDVILPTIKKMFKSEIIASRIEAIKAIGCLSLYDLSKFEEFHTRIQKLISIKNIQFRSFVIQALGRFGFSDFNIFKALLTNIIRVSFYPDLIPGLAKVLALLIQDHSDDILNEIKVQYNEKKLKEGLISLIQKLIKTSANKVDEKFIDSLIEIEKNKKIIQKLGDIKSSIKTYQDSYRICPICFTNNKLTSKFCAKDGFKLVPKDVKILEEIEEEVEKEVEIKEVEKIEKEEVKKVKEVKEEEKVEEEVKEEVAEIETEKKEEIKEKVEIEEKEVEKEEEKEVKEEEVEEEKEVKEEEEIKEVVEDIEAEKKEEIKEKVEIEDKEVEKEEEKEVKEEEEVKEEKETEEKK